MSLRIRELREARGWSQVELAERTGVRQATISTLETGKGRRLQDVLGKVAEALDVPPAKLLGDSAPEKRSRGRRRPK
jgi:transcriptional regulator with XRE-family HTH domain